MCGGPANWTNSETFRSVSHLCLNWCQNLFNSSFMFCGRRLPLKLRYVHVHVHAWIYSVTVLAKACTCIYSYSTSVFTFQIIFLLLYILLVFTQDSQPGSPLENAEVRIGSLHRFRRVSMPQHLRAQPRRRAQRLLHIITQYQQPGQLLHLLGRRRRVSRQAEGDVQARGQVML